MTDETRPITIQHEYVTDSTYVPRLFRAYVSLRILRPVTIASLVFIGLFVLVLGLTVFVGRHTDVLVAFIVLATLWGIIVVLYASILILIRRGMSRGTPIGSRFALGLGEEALRIEGPLASSEICYGFFRNTVVKDRFVFLQHRANKEYSAIPIELLPGLDLDRLRGAVARANA